MKVLVADDDVAILKVLKAELTEWGYEVITAVDGQQAWEALQEKDFPSIAILDWMMPVMPGIEICRKLREAPDSRLIYVIMLTARVHRDNTIEGLLAGADDYIIKPYNRSEMRARVGVGARMVEMQARLLDREKQLAVAETLVIEQQRFEAAVSAMSDGIVLTDGEWHITAANRAAVLLLNLPYEYNGISLFEVLGSFQLSIPASELGTQTERVSSLEIARPGTRPPLFVDGRLTRLFDHSGTLSSSVLTLRDVTRERHSQSLRSDFVMLVSHKLRTPLTVLGGYLKMCKQMRLEELTEHWSYILDTCDNEVQRLTGLVQKLLEMKAMAGQQFTAEVQCTGVQEGINAAEKRVRDRYPARSLAVTAKIAPGAAYAGINSEHLEVALEALLDNAVKFGDKDPVSVSIEVEPQEWGKLLFTVRDNGPGIPHEYFDRVLSGFIQIEDQPTGQVPGLGVGLFMARQVVEAYGGSISIQSRLGEGSAIIFTTPAGSDHKGDG